jgi:hypothetical protein
MLTRLQEFRQRNNQQRQMKQIATVVLGLLIYIYCLLGFQSQQAYREVVRLNLQRSRDEWMERFYRMQVYEMSKDMNRAERLQLKKEQREALKMWNFNHTSVNLRGAINSTAREIPSETAGERVAGTTNYLVEAFAFVMISRLLMRLFLFPRVAGTRREVTNRQRNAQNTSFRRWAQQLNRQREAEGERPLSVDALRLVLRDQMSDGTDYEGLLEFQEQSGPALDALLRSIGATDEEIERLPSRILVLGDDLLQANGRDGYPECAICLENFQLGGVVRTIPCFHSFHKDCIDPWLAEKASCPVCKHSAIA